MAHFAFALCLASGTAAFTPPAGSSAKPPVSPKPVASALPPLPTSASAQPARPEIRPDHPAARAKPAPARPAKPAAHPARSTEAGTGAPQRPHDGAAAPQRGVHVDDEGTRRGTGPAADDVSLGAESTELRALREAERELFPPAMPSPNAPWPNELPSALVVPDDAPHVHASGVPKGPPPSTPPSAEGGRDLSWLSHLELPPGLPVRWDARVVRFLEFFKDDPRGRQLFSFWLRRSGRYRDAIRRSLRKKGLPEDLLWLSMIESGFDPAARSPAGAVGLWQFMPDTGRLYGLSLDRWADQRLNVQAATDAAADFLGDLHRRFGSWELAIAAYNMGYGGVVSIVRKYNTNDYWALTQLEGAVPWETTLYVPKIIAIAVLTHNLGAFGYADVPLDAPTPTDEISVPPGTRLDAIASAAGCTTKELETLNLELRAGRTPPVAGATAAGGADPAQEAGYVVRVPAGKGAIATQNLAKTRHDAAAAERYVVKFGESLDQIAAAHHVPLAKLMELNAIAQGEVIRGGTVLLMPKSGAIAPVPVGPAAPPKQLATVVVPPDIFVYPDRKRVFYRVTVGDTLPAIASSLHVSVDELRRWNDVDPAARLQEGMTLQAFVAPGADLSHVLVLAEGDARAVPAGSDEFFAYWEGVKGRKRITVTAKAGETLEQIGRRYQVSGPMMERINHRPRSEALKEGELVVVHTPAPAGATGGASLASAAGGVTSTDIGPPLESEPRPDALPPLPSIDSLPELP